MPRVTLSASDKLLVKMMGMSDNDLTSVRNISTALLAERRKAAIPPKVRKTPKKRRTPFSPPAPALESTGKVPPAGNARSAD